MYTIPPTISNDMKPIEIYVTIPVLTEIIKSACEESFSLFSAYAILVNVPVEFSSIDLVNVTNNSTLSPASIFLFAKLVLIILFPFFTFQFELLAESNSKPSGMLSTIVPTKD